MKFEDALELAEYYYDGVKTRTARYFAEKLLALMKEFPQLEEYYTYDVYAPYWKNSFSKKEPKKTFNEIETLSGANVNGLYLVGSCYFNPLTDEKFYWIKVGKSKDLQKRMKTYATHNPMLWKNCYLPISDRAKTDLAETQCHNILTSRCIKKAKDSNEWFLVDRETYLSICNRGFNWFVDQIPKEFKNEFVAQFK